MHSKYYNKLVLKIQKACSNMSAMTYLARCIFIFFLLVASVFSTEHKIVEIAWPTFSAGKAQLFSVVSPGYTIIPAYLPNARIATVLDISGNTRYVLENKHQSLNKYYGSYTVPYDDNSYLALLYNKDNPGKNVIQMVHVSKGVIWQTYGTFHHEIIRDKAGNIYTFNEIWRTLPHMKQPILDNELVILDSNGKIIKTISLGLLLSNMGLKLVPSSAYRVSADILHANALHFLERDIVSGNRVIARNGDMVISIRHLNTIFIYNQNKNLVLWSWGPGEIQWQHYPTVSGNTLLVFDNGTQRKYSRILEVDIPTKKIITEYRAREKQDFYSAARGSVQRLLNGDLLICNSDSGQVVEIDRFGKVVWTYLTPEKNILNNKILPVPLYRVLRYKQLPLP